jgi:antirestriction protein ArdC
LTLLPWHRAGGSILCPVNVASKKAYRGINVVALWAYAEEFGYSSGVWGTYKQWAEAGAQVRQGEKAAFVVFYKELAFAADSETGDSETSTRLFARATPVFAAEQVDGFMPSTIDAPPITVTTPIEQAEAFVAATGASIHHGGGRPFYRPSTDSIHLPSREAFIGTKTSTPAESYFSTCVMSFATGPATRAAAIGSSASASATRHMRWRSWSPNSEPPSSAPTCASPTSRARITRNISRPGLPC